MSQRECLLCGTPLSLGEYATHVCGMLATWPPMALRRVMSRTENVYPFAPNAIQSSVPDESAPEGTTP